MKRIYLFLCLSLTMLFLAGCAQKIDPALINSSVIPSKTSGVATWLNDKSYSTYDSSEGKITMYHFKKVNNELKFSCVISYIPVDFYHEMYTELSGITMTLRILTHGQSHTLEEALDQEAAKHGFTRLFKDKNEFIIGNDFAFEIQTAIRRYNDRIANFERDRDKEILKDQ